MRRTLNLVWTLAVALSATQILAASPLMAASSQSATATPVTKITFSMMSGSVDEVANYRTLLDQFNAANKDVQVEFLEVSGDYYQKIVSMLATGTAPDLFWYGGANSAQLIRDGVLADLTPFIEKDPDFNLADFFPSAVNPFRWQGGLYGIPRDVSPLVLYYNVDSFNNAGLQSPNDYHARKAWNWDNFLNVARKLSDPKAPTPRYGMSTDWWWGLWFPWILTNGGEIFSPDYKEARFDSPKAKEGLKFFVDLITVHKVVPSPDQANALGGHWELFVRGQAAMYPTGRWAVPGLRQTKGLNFDAVVMPYKVRQGSPLFTGIYAISAASTKKQAAFRLLKWMVSPESQLKLAAQGQVLPSRVSAAASKEFVGAVPPQHNMVFVEAAQNGYLEPVFPEFGKVMDATWGPFWEMFNGRMTVDNAIESIMPQVKQVMGMK